MKTKILFYGLLVFIASNMKAQIIHTEIPASVDQGQDFHIDFNNDGTPEFNVYTNEHQADYIDYDGNTQENIHAKGTAESGWDVPNCVDYGFTIDASNNWIGQGDCSITNWGNGNDTITTDTDEYLAVRFSIGNNTYYGWIKIEVDFENNVTFKEYAYQSIPNTAIQAGYTDASIINDYTNNNNIDFTIYPNPAKNTITIGYNSEKNIYGIEIIDMLGKEMIKMPISDLNSNTINISKLNNGIYTVLLLEKGKKTIYKKLVVNQ